MTDDDRLQARFVRDQHDVNVPGIGWLAVTRVRKTYEAGTSLIKEMVIETEGGHEYVCDPHSVWKVRVHG